MEPFKNLYNQNSISEMARALKNAYPAFDKVKFQREVLHKIKNLEMKDRVRAISVTLKEFLPKNYSEAITVLLKTIRTEKNPRGLNNFLVWPYTQFVEDFGLDEWEISTEALKQLTLVMSAEFAIRPFLLKEEKRTLHLLHKWAKDSNHHVRRLSSEGSRPRLPWGQRLKNFQSDPKHTIPILRLLKNDPELYVRKSVANHLNDLAKDHPNFVLNELDEWINAEPNNKAIQWIAKHACRTLIKNGNPKALALFGVKSAKFSKTKINLSPAEVKLGKDLHIEFQAYAHRKEKWLIDYIIHHKKKNGSHAPKVFKWTERVVQKGSIKLSKKHPFRVITTRKYYSGDHYLEIQLNGRSVGKKKFYLE